VPIFHIFGPLVRNKYYSAKNCKIWLKIGRNLAQYRQNFELELFGDFLRLAKKLKKILFWYFGIKCPFSIFSARWWEINIICQTVFAFWFKVSSTLFLTFLKHEILQFFFADINLFLVISRKNSVKWLKNVIRWNRMRPEFKIFYHISPKLVMVIFYQIKLNKNRFFCWNGNFNQKSKFWSKMEFLTKNQNFQQICKFWAKIEILIKNEICSQKSKFWAKKEFLTKNRNFDQKWNFWPKIEIVIKNWIFNQKSKFWAKI